LAASARGIQLADEIKVLQALEALQQESGITCHPHKVLVHHMDGELSVSFHCRFDASLPIGEAHAQTELIERLLRARLPELGRVVIHTDPSRPTTSHEG
jgi:divalent metal cation (Fe/Co/Zn/Cd) transporter